MRPIETITIIGLGAVGINFAQYLRSKMQKSQLRILADKERIQRYKKQGVFYNDTLCDFHYIDDSEEMKPADLVLICTKFGALQDAMKRMKHQIGPETIIMSAINGISSEEILSTVYHKENIIYTIAQGMDASKLGNRVTCQNMGELCFGTSANIGKEKVERVYDFFTSIHFPCTIKENILQHQWSKFMYNVGLNQVVAIHNGCYQLVQEEGEAQDEMIGAMREVMMLSAFEHITLTKDDIASWLSMTKQLSPQGKPSMAQDVAAKRKSEVELFSGTVLKLAKKHGVQVPVNQKLYYEIQQLEATYDALI